MENKIKIGYWGIRGAAQVSRLLAAYGGVEVENVLYNAREKWFDEDKKNIGFDFPNLPYLIDGDFKLTESSAMQNYIINKSGKTDLFGKNAVDRAEVNRLISVYNDAFKEVRGLAWNKDYETVKAEKLEKIKGKLDQVQHFIGDKSFFLGYLTLIDFIVAEASYIFEAIYPVEYKRYSVFGRIRRNFNNLPEIKAYYAREDSFKGPFLPPGMAAVTVDPKDEPEPQHKDIIVGYWGIRGLGQIARLLLAYNNVDFENQQYTSPEAWFGRDKTALNLEFANIPYLITPEVKLTESAAIYRYIIDKYNPELLGKNIHDSAVVDEVVGVWKDAAGDLIGLFFDKEYEAHKGAALEKAKPKFDLLQKFIGEKTTVLGYLTFADFVIAEYGNYFTKLFPEESKAWPFLTTIRENFNQLPQIVKYYESEGATKGPFLPPSAAIPF